MERSQGKSLGTIPNKVDIFKTLLSNKVNKVYIDRSKTKRKQKGKNHRTRLNRVDIVTWLLRNGINKMDIDG